MALKCYERTNKSGGKYTTCNKDAQENNVTDNKMPPKKTPSGNTPNSEKSQEWHDSNRFWKAAQLRLIPGIRDLIPAELKTSVFGHDTKKTGKQQRTDFLRIRAFKQLKTFADDSTDAKLKTMVGDLSESYDTYIARRKAATKAMKGGGAAPKPTMKKEDETRPASKAKEAKQTGLNKAPYLMTNAERKAKKTQKRVTAKLSGPSAGRAKEDKKKAPFLMTAAQRKASRAPKPAAKKVAVSYRVGSGPMKKSTATVGKTGTGAKIGRVVATKKAPTRARARKATAPVKNAKTAPQKVSRFDLISGRTGNDMYEALGKGIGIPKYGNKVKPGKTFLKRNR